MNITPDYVEHMYAVLHGKRRTVPANVAIAHELLTRELTYEPQTIRDICEKRGWSEYFVQQIARKLRLAGLLKVKKGPGGGVYKEAA